ncbi:MAG: prepilin-type N-terminal cleavage/methylation domain-containing protein, partial [Candidatus Omnitrophica bacterium]|nr:prepilin-type N-terminal cleavage/methylation domain-containing protein [Candidatus Omnitrophota bacterium]
MGALNCKIKNNGFTLIEVIIAVGILSAGVVVVLQAISFSGQMSGFSNDTVQAVLLAEDKLQDLEISEKKKSLVPGSVKDKNDKFEWVTTVRNNGNAWGLYDIVFGASWLSHGQKREVGFET